MGLKNTRSELPTVYKSVRLKGASGLSPLGETLRRIGALIVVAVVVAVSHTCSLVQNMRARGHKTGDIYEAEETVHNNLVHTRPAILN